MNENRNNPPPVRNDDGRQPAQDITNKPQPSEQPPDANAAGAGKETSKPAGKTVTLFRDGWYAMLPTLGYVRDNTAKTYHNLRQMFTRKFNPDSDIINQAGKVILVTGGMFL